MSSHKNIVNIKLIKNATNRIAAEPFDSRMKGQIQSEYFIDNGMPADSSNIEFTSMLTLPEYSTVPLEISTYLDAFKELAKKYPLPSAQLNLNSDSIFWRLLFEQSIRNGVFSNSGLGRGHKELLDEMCSLGIFIPKKLNRKTEYKLTPKGVGIVEILEAVTRFKERTLEDVYNDNVNGTSSWGIKRTSAEKVIMSSLNKKNIYYVAKFGGFPISSQKLGLQKLVILPKKELPWAENERGLLKNIDLEITDAKDKKEIKNNIDKLKNADTVLGPFLGGTINKDLLTAFNIDDDTYICNLREWDVSYFVEKFGSDIELRIDKSAVKELHDSVISSAKNGGNPNIENFEYGYRLLNIPIVVVKKNELVGYFMGYAKTKRTDTLINSSAGRNRNILRFGHSAFPIFQKLGRI